MRLGVHGLPLRSSVIARRRRRLRLALGCLGLGFFTVIGAAAWKAWPDRAQILATVSQSFRTPVPARVESADAAVSPRPVYRHSILPGGAYSQKEVVAAVRRDAVVAAHYKAIDVERVRPVTVTAARAVYVSYRRGNEVFWTKRPVQLTPGETLLTDGTSEIRARCGNRVSDHARQPVAADEPAVVVLDAIETGGESSSMAEERTDASGLIHVPFLQAWGNSLAGGQAPDGVTADRGFGLGGGPSFVGGGGFGPGADPSGGPVGGSPVTTLGGSARSGGGVTFVPPGTPDDPGTTTGGQSTTGAPGTTTGDAGPTNGVTTGTTTGDTTTTGFVTTGYRIAETTDGGPGDTDGEVPSIPEPATLTLLGLGALGVAMRARRSRR